MNKTGVEVNYKIYSPMIKKIEVIKPAGGSVKTGTGAGELKDLGRAKVNYLRDKPGVMNQIASAVRATAAVGAAAPARSTPPAASKNKKK